MNLLSASHIRVMGLAGGLLLALVACAGPGADLPPVPPPPAGPYALGPGDQLRLIVYGDKELSADFAIGDDGAISLPLIGAVPAAGHDTATVAATVAAALRRQQLMQDPSVAAEVETYRPVFVLGEVGKPGQYPYEPGMSVIAAISVAGGYTYRAVHARVGILRRTKAGPVEGQAAPMAAVAPGDVITVFERRF